MQSNVVTWHTSWRHLGNSELRLTGHVIQPHFHPSGSRDGVPTCVGPGNKPRDVDVSCWQASHWWRAVTWPLSGAVVGRCCWIGLVIGRPSVQLGALSLPFKLCFLTIRPALQLRTNVTARTLPLRTTVSSLYILLVGISWNPYSTVAPRTLCGNTFSPIYWERRCTLYILCASLFDTVAAQGLDLAFIKYFVNAAYLFPLEPGSKNSTRSRLQYQCYLASSIPHEGLPLSPQTSQVLGTPIAPLYTVTQPLLRSHFVEEIIAGIQSYRVHLWFGISWKFPVVCVCLRAGIWWTNNR